MDKYKKCIKMFKRPCYEHGGEMDKNNIHGIIDSKFRLWMK